MEFQCSGCGACCMLAGKRVVQARSIPHYKRNKTEKMAAAFPYKFSETGRCDKLTEDNKCSVYDKRPLICRVEQSYTKINKKQPSGRHYFHVATLCNTFMDNLNIDESYRLDPSIYLKKN